MHFQPLTSPALHPPTFLQNNNVLYTTSTHIHILPPTLRMQESLAQIATKNTTHLAHLHNKQKQMVLVVNNKGIKIVEIQQNSNGTQHMTIHATVRPQEWLKEKIHKLAWITEERVVYLLEDGTVVETNLFQKKWNEEDVLVKVTEDDMDVDDDENTKRKTKKSRQSELVYSEATQCCATNTHTIDLNTRIATRHPLAVLKRKITSLDIHPSESILAIGNKKGEIIIYDYKKQQIKSKWHWHAHPVNKVLFFNSGRELLSAGREAVLVIWQVQTGSQDFMARLGGDITEIACNDSHALVTVNNDLQLISLVAREIQQESVGLTIDSLPIREQGVSKPLPHEKSGSILYPARTSLESLNLANLQVTRIPIGPQHYISAPDQNGEQLHPVLQCFALSRCGTHMATVEWHESWPQGLLKFWEHDVIWELRTMLDVNAISDITFHPAKPQCVTVGATGISVYDLDGSWQKTFDLDYQGQSGSYLCWSQDGSLLAVVFGTNVTLWDDTFAFLRNVTSGEGLISGLNFDEPYLRVVRPGGATIVNVLKNDIQCIRGIRSIDRNIGIRRDEIVNLSSGTTIARLDRIASVCHVDDHVMITDTNGCVFASGRWDHNTQQGTPSVINPVSEYIRTAEISTPKINFTETPTIIVPAVSTGALAHLFEYEANTAPLIDVLWNSFASVLSRQQKTPPSTLITELEGFVPYERPPNDKHHALFPELTSLKSDDQIMSI